MMAFTPFLRGEDMYSPSLNFQVKKGFCFFGLGMGFIITLRGGGGGGIFK